MKNAGEPIQATTNYGIDDKGKARNRNGRPTNSVVTQRKEIIKTVYEQHLPKNYDELMVYARPEMEARNLPVPKERTIQTYLKQLEITLGSPSKPTISRNIFKTVQAFCSIYIRQIHVQTFLSDFMIYNKYDRDSTKEYYYDQYLDDFNELHNAYSLEDIESSLVRIYIIFENTNMYTEYVRDVFEHECSYILYTSAHNRAVEICIEYKNYKDILSYLLLIFS